MVNRALIVAGTMSSLLWCGQIAQARSGLAAYNEHTGAMVTAARYEPHGSVLRVTNPRNGRSVTVTVNDRGPFNGGRILDLSTGAFSELFGGLGRGVGPISYEVVGGSSHGSALPSRGGYQGRSKSRTLRRAWHRRHYHHWRGRRH